MKVGGFLDMEVSNVLKNVHIALVDRKGWIGDFSSA